MRPLPLMQSSMPMPPKFPRRRRLLLLRFVTLPMLDAAVSKPIALGEDGGDRILPILSQR